MSVAFKIKDIEVENPVVLAPMAGVGNLAFRTLVKEFGAGLIYAEMVSDKAVNFKNKKTLEMLEVDETEHPMSLQVFGGSKESFVEAAIYIDEHSACDIIDINMGCPVPKVTKNEAGAKLLLDADKIYDIVSNVVSAVSKPVTVKMRAGWDDQTIYVSENAKAVEAAGASALAVHGRTAKQMYRGHAQWDYIRQAKQAISIPVIGNGDVRKPEDAKRMLEETGCDGVMIGRAALGNPWMIAQTVAYLENGTYDDFISAKERLAIARDHMERLYRQKGEKLAILEMRSHLSWYVKGIKGNTTFKQTIQKTTSIDALREVINEYERWLEIEG